MNKRDRKSLSTSQIMVIFVCKEKGNTYNRFVLFFEFNTTTETNAIYAPRKLKIEIQRT